MPAQLCSTDFVSLVPMVANGVAMMSLSIESGRKIMCRESAVRTLHFGGLATVLIFIASIITPLPFSGFACLLLLMSLTAYLFGNRLNDTYDMRFSRIVEDPEQGD